MLTKEEKEILQHICKNSNDDIFKSYNAEFIKGNLHTISELENKGFVKKSCDDLYNALAVIILPKTYTIIKK